MTEAIETLDLANALGLDPYPKRVRAKRALSYPWRIPWLMWRLQIGPVQAARTFHWWVWYGPWDWPKRRLGRDR